jgi:membrane associated rhomboid family serine protease
MFIPFRDENKNHIIPYATIIIIFINIIVYLLMFLLIQEEHLIHYYRIFGSIPYEMIEFKSAESVLDFVRPFPFFFTLVTSLFIHSTPMHLIGNMLYLWIFGKRIEDYLGSLRFILFFLISGIIASYAHALINYYGFLLPEILQSSPYTPAIGASGVIAACMGAYLIKFPKSIIDFLFIFIVLRIRAYWFLIFWIFGQIISVAMPMGGATENNTAWFAHIGGFVGGIGLVMLFGWIFNLKVDVEEDSKDEKENEDND